MNPGFVDFNQWRIDQLLPYPYFTIISYRQYKYE